MSIEVSNFAVRVNENIASRIGGSHPATRANQTYGRVQVVMSTGGLLGGNIPNSVFIRIRELALKRSVNATAFSMIYHWRSPHEGVLQRIQTEGGGAWSDNEDAAYRGAEFMQQFQKRGTAVHIEKGRSVESNLTILDKTNSN